MADQGPGEALRARKAGGWCRDARRSVVRRGLFIGLLLAACLWRPALAQSLVLIHGMASTAAIWHESGVVDELGRAGWTYAGELGREVTSAEVRTRPSAYTLRLDSLAPMQAQLHQLEQALAGFRSRRQSLILVGHSAGGVLARLYMVRHPDAPVRALISIASPNLGSEGAALAGLAHEGPWGWMAEWLPPQAERPLRLASELAPERPGNFLFWLNRQPHPQATYLAVVHTGDDTGGLPVRAWLVTPESQDLAGVAALRGRTRSLRLRTGHALGPLDGPALVRILRSLSRA